MRNFMYIKINLTFWSACSSLLLFGLHLHAAPVANEQQIQAEQKQANDPNLELIVLGVAQDAGYPQINCYQPHCMAGWQEPAKQKLATSIGIIDHQNKRKYIFEATPDIKAQFYRLHQLAPDEKYKLAGIFLTHGHIGHYSGLMHLGREAAATNKIPVYVMPRMADFLSSNGPWSQLVTLANISLKLIAEKKTVTVSSNLQVTPFSVPHRDEYTETVGFKITGPNKSVLFIPDIDKWQKWSLKIIEQIKLVDYAFLDGTFFSALELPDRDMSEIPHPMVEESMKLFVSLSKSERKKIIFIHFNHSNPLLQEASEAQQTLVEKGYQIAKEGMRIAL